MEGSIDLAAEWMRSRHDLPMAAAGYLQAAAEALTACGSAPALYSKFLGVARDYREEVERYVRQREGPRMQMHFARNCILFSAFAAEAYVNGFLSERLSGSDFDAVDRLPTIDKYVVGVAYAEGTTVFRRNANPGQALKVLFELRNALVHPKPGKQIDLAKVSPYGAAKYLVSVAQAARELSVRGGEFDLISLLLETNAAKLVSWGRKWNSQIPAVDAPEPPDLLNQFALPFLQAALAEQH